MYKDIKINNIICDNEQKFECKDCPDICCKSFSITIDHQTLNNYTKLEFIQHLFIKLNKSFIKINENKYYLPISDCKNSNRCLFLDNTEHCLIHSRLSYKAKPLTCRVYPFSFYFDAENNVHIETSFKCKSILENYGKPLTELKEELAYKYINLEYYPEEYPLDNSIISQKKVFKLTDELTAILQDSTQPIEKSIKEYFEHLYSFKKQHTEVKKTGTRGFFNLSESDLLNLHLTNLFLYENFSRNNSLYQSSIRLLVKYYKIITWLASKYKFFNPLNNTTKVNLQKLFDTSFFIDKDSEDILRRYLASSCKRYQYMSEDKENLNFFNKPILYYALIKDYAKVQAIAENRNKTSYSDIKKAISQVEFVYFHINTPIIPVKGLTKQLNLSYQEFFRTPEKVYNLIEKE